MSEETFLGLVREKLRHSAYVHKHNDLTEGVSDLSVCFKANGRTVWVELKVKDKWPVKPGTRIWWDHYTEQQALWLRRRRGWLFVRVGKCYALFTGAEAWRMWEAHGYTNVEFLGNAHTTWFNACAWLDLIKVLREE